MNYCRPMCPVCSRRRGILHLLWFWHKYVLEKNGDYYFQPITNTVFRFRNGYFIRDGGDDYYSAIWGAYFRLNDLQVIEYKLTGRLRGLGR